MVFFQFFPLYPFSSSFFNFLLWDQVRGWEADMEETGKWVQLECMIGNPSINKSYVNKNSCHSDLIEEFGSLII